MIIYNILHNVVKCLCYFNLNDAIYLISLKLKLLPYLKCVYNNFEF